jgi:hypothetical protein
VDQHQDPVLIDIEGLMFFDVEWEHAFLRILFGEHNLLRALEFLARLADEPAGAEC